MLLFTIVFDDGTDEKMTKCYFEMASTFSDEIPKALAVLARVITDKTGRRIFTFFVDFA